MNKLVVVTGGTKGIGRAIIEKFAGNGFDIVTCARTQKDLDALKDQVKQSIELHTFKADLSKKDQVIRFVDFINNLKRPVDVLVNNAGYFVSGEITTEADGNLEEMMNSNLYSAYHTTRGIVPIMKAQRSGHVINICSIASITAYKNGGSYAITKFAMLGFSKCLREELKSFSIRVTSVLPGSTKTDSWANTDLPDDRFMKAEDIADLIYAAHSISARSVVEEIIIRPQLGDI